MKNKQFDFKDLMAFGSFILALLAFIFTNVSIYKIKLFPKPAVSVKETK